MFGAGDYHRGVADEGTFVIAVIGNLGFQCQEAPGLATVDAFLLQVIDLFGAEYLVGSTRTIGAGELHQRCIALLFEFGGCAHATVLIVGCQAGPGR